MANKNHALDQQITEAAMQEFLTYGFEKASLRKIAASAGVTVGAIYTRYPTKDALFCSLTEPLIARIERTFSALRDEFRTEADSSSRSSMIHAMQDENQAILHLLFDDYQRSVLLLCRSGGSSLEHFFDTVVQRKIQETLSFFRGASVPYPDESVLKLLLKAQFHMYFEIISEGYDLNTAKRLLNAATVYHTGGWFALLGIHPENSSQEVSGNEV